MTSLVLTPFTTGRPIELAGGLWRKRLLPVGEIAYKGRTLKFTRDYLGGLVDAFRARAYDQVPLQLAGADNAHTNDVERTAGHIVDMDADDDGLWITAAVNDRGQGVLATNPELGVSARIVEDYARADGRHFPAAVQHVLATLDPRIPGLGAWRAVEAANLPDVAIVIDLSSADWQGMDPPAEPWEIAAADQALAEADDGGDPEAEDWGPWLDAVIADAEAEMAENPETWQMSAEDCQLAIELANANADAGNWETAARALAELGEPFIELANGDLHEVNRVLDLAAEAEMTRQAEDAAPMPAEAEARLSYLLDRCRRGTYTPSSYQMANPASGAAAALAHHRWASAQPDYANAVIPGSPCGEPDLTGRCMERYHQHGCSAIASPDIATVLQSGGAYDRLASQPWLDDNHRLWQDQHGSAMTLADHLRAASGTRRTPEPFTGQRSREVPQAQRQARYGDPDDPRDPGEDLNPAAMAALARRTGLRQPTAASERERYAALRNRALADIGLRAHGRVHPDLAESTRERAARLHRPVVLTEAEADPGPGGLMRYTAG
jgi:hypothetical protein